MSSDGKVTTSDPAATGVRCDVCGQPIVQRRSGGRFVHRSRVIAACDLDADHAAVPDHPADPAPRPG